MDKESIVKRKYVRNKARKGKPQFNHVLSAEEDRRFTFLQETWGQPSRAETFRKMLQDVYERTTTRDFDTVMGMFQRVLGALESLDTQQERFRLGLTQEIEKFIRGDLANTASKVANAVDIITMTSETASLKAASRIEANIAITKQMEIDLKQRVDALLKVASAHLVRYKVEQAIATQRDPALKEVLENALAKTGFAGI